MQGKSPYPLTLEPNGTHLTTARVPMPSTFIPNGSHIRAQPISLIHAQPFDSINFIQISNSSIFQVFNFNINKHTFQSTVS